MSIQKTSGILWVTATPIGNLKDISIRAIEVLKKVDFIYCEDTRVTQKLLTAYGIEKSLHVYNDHATESIRQKLLARLKEGLNVAFVSDAGTPLISDPGYKIIQACYDQNISVQALPGATALIQALVLSGLPTNCFYFGGFLPATDKDREQLLLSVSHIKGTLVFYETPKRILNTLQTLGHHLGNRQAVIARELTKSYEEIIRGDINGLLDTLPQHQSLKGEMVLLVEGAVKSYPPQLIQHKKILSMLIEDVGAKKASLYAAALLDCPKRDVYNFLVQKDNTEW